jgi:hypothetical protein
VNLPRMICRHGAANKREAKLLWRRVTTALDCQEGWEITAIVTSMWHDFDAELDCVATDQWSLVRFETFPGSPKSFSSSFQCDRVEDGFAACWLAFAEHFWNGYEPLEYRAAVMRGGERG